MISSAPMPLSLLFHRRLLLAILKLTTLKKLPRCWATFLRLDPKPTRLSGSGNETLKIDHSQADLQGIFDIPHHFLIQMSNLIG